MSRLIALLLRDVAEGRYGLRLQKLYWQVKGYKTWTGFILSVTAFALHQAEATGQCPDCSTWSTWVAAVGGFLLTLGLVDGGLHMDPPLVSDPRKDDKRE